MMDAKPKKFFLLPCCFRSQPQDKIRTETKITKMAIPPVWRLMADRACAKLAWSDARLSLWVACWHLVLCWEPHKLLACLAVVL